MQKIRIGTFNVNNLFERPRIMELEGFNQMSREVTDSVAQASDRAAVFAEFEI